MNNVMVINMGLKSIRCIIFNQKGQKLGSAAMALNTAISDKCVEQNPVEWWEKAELVMQKALAGAGNPKIQYITVTASASCLVCVDKNGNSLGKAFMVSDKRADEEVELIRNMQEFQAVKLKTGLDMSASLMLPKIFWIKRNQPEIFDKTECFMTPNDYLIYKLCGECVTDYLNAVKYHFDIESFKYPKQLLQKLQISERTFPRVVDTGEAVGRISEIVAQRNGLDTDVQIVVTSYDAICSFVGSGVSEEGETSDVSGTVTVFRTLSRKKEIAASDKIYRVPFFQGNMQIVGGSNNLGGGLIEWGKQCYYQEVDYPYEIMEKEARESEVGARGLVFLPYLLGERAPLWNDDARGVFFGLERMHTRKDMIRAVFESTGFIDMDMMEAIRQTGVEVETVRLSGGLARIDLVSQIKSDIMGRDVMVLEEFETTASGAAMMVLLGRGVYQDMSEMAKSFVQIRMLIKPNMENHKKYTYMYELYKDTYESLKPLFMRRKRILEHFKNNMEVQIENL